MAQAIHCDVHNRDHLADVLVSQLATGDTMAACTEGYLDLCRAYVAAADAIATETDQADQDVADRIAAAGPAPDVDQEADGQGEGLDQETTGQDPTGSALSSDVATVPPGEPGRPADGPTDSEGHSDATQARTGRQRQPRIAREGEAAEPASA